MTPVITVKEVAKQITFTIAGLVGVCVGLGLFAIAMMYLVAVIAPLFA